MAACGVGGKVCEMGRLGAQRGGTHVLCVCPSFPESPRPGGEGAPPSFVSISGVHRAPVPSWGSASRLFCWRETVRKDRRLLGPPPSSSQLPAVPTCGLEPRVGSALSPDGNSRPPDAREPPGALSGPDFFLSPGRLLVCPGTRPSSC